MTRRQEKREQHGALHRTLVRIALTILLGPTVGAVGAVGAQVRQEYRELHMGVEVRIVLYARDDAHARGAARAAFDRIAALEDKMSDYRPESELRRLERAHGVVVRVSPELFDVLWSAHGMARATQGAFDPTTGPLVRVWRAARRTGKPPDGATLDSARARVGWHALVLDSTRRTVQLDRPGMQLDLGGVAKGYILARALETLRTLGAGAALIEAGGDLALGDAPPGESGWTVAAPHGDSAVRHRAASLANVFVATSGPGAQSVTIDGKRYSHVIDARTGMPLARWEHATVIATDGMLADALATALTLIGPERRAALVQDYQPYLIAWSVTDYRRR